MILQCLENVRASAAVFVKEYGGGEFPLGAAEHPMIQQEKEFFAEQFRGRLRVRIAKKRPERFDEEFVRQIVKERFGQTEQLCHGAETVFRLWRAHIILTAQ